MAHRLNIPPIERSDGSSGSISLPERPSSTLWQRIRQGVQGIFSHQSLANRQETLPAVQNTRYDNIVSSTISPRVLEEAVIKAAEEGCIETVSFLLSDGRTIDQREWEWAVGVAAARGRVEAVRCLLSVGRTIDQRALEHAVIGASAGNHVETLRFLLSDGRTLAQGAWEWVVGVAAERGSVETLRFLFSDRRRINQRVLELAVGAAAKGGQIEALRFLLSEGKTIELRALENAFIRAAEKGQIETLRFFSEIRCFKSRVLEEAVIGAAARGRVEALRFLLSEDRALAQGEPINHQALRLAVIRAAEEGQIETLRFFSKGRMIAPWNGEEFIIKAAARGRVEAVRFLLSSAGRITEPRRLEEAMIQAAAGGHIETVRCFLKGRTITPGVLEVAVRVAAEGGHIETVRCLLSEGRTIEQRGLGWVVIGVAGRGHIEILKFLLSEGRTIEPEALGEAVKEAAEEGHIEIVRFLLSEGRTIEQQALGVAVKEAAEEGHIETVRFLLSEGRTIEPEALGVAVLSAAARGHLSIVEFLTHQGPIGESVRDSAITNTSGPDRDRICDILRSARTVPDHFAVARSQDRPKALFIMLSDIKKQPTAYLHTLFTTGLPASIYVIDENGMGSPAVDAGGISKQFITSLCEALVQQKQWLNLSDQGIPSKRGDSPTYEHLGRLFSLIYEKNLQKTDKILTGHLVNERFLEMVKAIATADCEEEGFEKVCTLLGKIDPTLQPAVDFLSNPSQESEFLDTLALESVEEGAEAAEAFLQPYYLAARDFLVGTTQAFRERLEQSNVRELARAVQGNPLTVVDVLRSLRLASNRPLPASCTAIINGLASHNSGRISALRNQLLQTQDRTTGNFEDKIIWLVKAIALKDLSRKEDREWLEKFLFAITSKKVMEPGMTLRLQESWREEMVFEMHTCFNGLDVPKGALDRQSFLSALDFAISTESYNIA